GWLRGGLWQRRPRRPGAARRVYRLAGGLVAVARPCRLPGTGDRAAGSIGRGLTGKPGGRGDAMDKATVLVVGAGPTGLLAAAELQRRGVDCLLIDAHDRPPGWDRATVVHPRSLEIFDQL